jgi:hypothetical protein
LREAHSPLYGAGCDGWHRKDASHNREWERMPLERFDLASVDTLRPWQPPSIHLLRDGSAFELRASHQPEDTINGLCRAPTRRAPSRSRPSPRSRTRG